MAIISLMVKPFRLPGPSLMNAQFYDANGNEIVVNTGKTYIAIVPSDVWDDLVIK